MKNNIFKGAGVALVTPMNEDYSINYKKLNELVDWQIANKTDAIIACGTTGESATLSTEEHLKIIEEVVKTTKNRVPIIAGTGSNNTKKAIEMSKQAQKLKADAVLVVTPYYNKTSQQGIIEHYFAIANNIDIPLIVYEVPSRTGLNISTQTFKKLSTHKNIVAVKAASGSISEIAQIAANCNQELSIFSGNDDQIVPVMSLGGVGVISVLSNILPKETHEICQYCFKENYKESSKLQLKLLKLINALFIDVNPIPVKEALNLMNMNVGPCRLPLYKLDITKLEELKKILKSYSLINF